MSAKKSRKTRKVRPYVVRFITLRGDGSHRSHGIPGRFTTKAAGQKAIERAFSQKAFERAFHPESRTFGLCSKQSRYFVSTETRFRFSRALPTKKVAK